MDMTGTLNQQPIVTRTERGLTITGTRITIYDVMDYVAAKYPPQFIQGLLHLTETQINEALKYIQANRVEVESEYQLVLKEAEELKNFYAEQNHELTAKISKMPSPSGREAVWQKLRQQKAELGAKSNIPA